MNGEPATVPRRDRCGSSRRNEQPSGDLVAPGMENEIDHLRASRGHRDVLEVSPLLLRSPSLPPHGEDLRFRVQIGIASSRGEVRFVGESSGFDEALHRCEIAAPASVLEIPRRAIASSRRTRDFLLPVPGSDRGGSGSCETVSSRCSRRRHDRAGVVRGNPRCAGAIRSAVAWPEGSPWN